MTGRDLAAKFWPRQINQSGRPNGTFGGPQLSLRLCPAADADVRRSAASGDGLETV